MARQNGIFWSAINNLAQRIYDKLLVAFSFHFKGMNPGFIWFIIVVILACIGYLIFRKKHSKPLSYAQIQTLSQRYAKEYINRNYHFSFSAGTRFPLFNPSTIEDRTWNDLEAPVKHFPAHISALLKQEESEWVIFAIEKNGYIKALWINRGFARSNIYLQYDLYSVLEKCQQLGGYTIFRLHNHLGSNKDSRSVLEPNEEESTNARECSEITCQNGINWYDFICAEGIYRLFYHQISESFELPGKDVSSIIDKINITPTMDYKMQKEYYNLNNISGIIKNKVFIICVLLIILVIIWLFA